MSKKKLNILFLHGDSYPTSRSEMKELFERELQARGHQIHYIMFTDEIEKRTMKRVHNNIFHLIPSSYGSKSESKRKRIIEKNAREIVKQHPIDVIQVRDDIFLAMLAIELCKEFDLLFAFRLSTLFHSLDKDLIKHRKSIGNVLRYIRGIRNQRRYRKVIDRCDLFLPISKAMEEHYRTRFPNKKMLPLPLQAPHDFINYRSDENNKPKSKKRIIYIGQISYIRNMTFMIDVLSKLSEDVEIMFVGPPQQDFVVDQMKAHARKLGIEDRMIFVGKVDKSEIPKYITSAHIGISPIPPLKAFRMSSPTKVVEYLSLGVPVVGNKEIEDQRYVIEESGGGFAVEYDIDKFSEAINILLINPEIKKQRGKRGKEWIEENRNYKILAEKLEEAYYSTINILR